MHAPGLSAACCERPTTHRSDLAELGGLPYLDSDSTIMQHTAVGRGRLCVIASTKAAPLVAGPPIGYDHRVLRPQSEALVGRQHPELLPLVQDGERRRRRRRRRLQPAKPARRPPLACLV